MNACFVLIISAVLLAWAVNALATTLNLRALDPELPPEFRDVYEPDRYRTSQNYTRESSRLGLIEDFVEALVLVAAIALGLFGMADSAARSPGWGPIPTGLLFFGIIILAQQLLSLPFKVWSTFVLEERYGFNTTTPALFIADLLKGLVLGVVIGGGLLAGVLWLLATAGDAGWLLAWAFITLVAIFLQFIAPVWIMPLFNKFTPLEDGELKSRLENLAHRAGYEVAGIFVMDGSKRSKRANAFFTGFGKTRKIVLFDTLLDTIAPQGIEAVLAHEIGHYKLGHLKKLLVSSAARTGLMLWLLSLAINSPCLQQGLGLTNVSLHGGLLAFLVLFTPASMLLSTAFLALSRRYERQADSYAASLTTAAPLAEALKKLSMDNLSNLTPHRAKVVLSYGHPPVIERVRYLEKLEK